jgi:hypothetical protein
MLQAAELLFTPEGELPRRALEHSLALHCRCQAMYDRAFWKIAVRVLGKVCGSPYKEQRHLFYPLRGWRFGSIKTGNSGTWRHPESGEMRRESLDDLARHAVERTVALFRRIEAGGTLAAALSTPPGANLLTGLQGVKKEES